MIDEWVRDAQAARREIFCLSKDIPNLPKEPKMISGCTAYIIDTQDVYIYDREKREWVLQ